MNQTNLLFTSCVCVCISLLLYLCLTLSSSFSRRRHKPYHHFYIVSHSIVLTLEANLVLSSYYVHIIITII